MPTIRCLTIWAIAGSAVAGCEQTGVPNLPDSAAADTGSTDGIAASCGAAKPNELGVGKPCTTSADCAGQPATTCLPVPGQGSLCSKPCVTADAPGVYVCGQGAKCAPRGSEPAMCAPQGCLDAATIAPKDVGVLIPCTAGQVNACGVGLLCQTWMDCAPFGKGAECPHVVEGEDKVPNYCVQHCGQDSDCCGNAFCWWRKEHGFQWVGNCIPTACKKPGN